MGRRHLNLACCISGVTVIAMMSAEGSLTRSESGNERLRQEADASRAEIWRKIQAAKLNNSKKQQQVGGAVYCSLHLTACWYAQQ